MIIYYLVLFRIAIFFHATICVYVSVYMSMCMCTFKCVHVYVHTVTPRIEGGQNKRGGQINIQKIRNRGVKINGVVN